MKKILKPALLTLLGALIIVQFFHPAKNINEKPDGSEKDISSVYPLPDSVHAILQTSCYDCHSNNTKYPWYSNIQPVAWWLDHHIEEGKREVNFNEFASYRISRQYKKLQDIIDEVKEDEMPLSSYTLIHTDAKLNSQQKNVIINWADSVRSIIRNKYPADSLVREKHK